MGGVGVNIIQKIYKYTYTTIYYKMEMLQEQNKEGNGDSNITLNSHLCLTLYPLARLAFTYFGTVLSYIKRMFSFLSLKSLITIGMLNSTAPLLYKAM